MVKTVIYTKYEDLPAHHERLLVEFERRNIYCGRAWFRNFTRNTLEAEAKPRIYVAEDQDGKPLVMLFMRAPAGQNGSYLKDQTFPMQTLASMTNYQSAAFAPVMVDNGEAAREALRQLIRTICAEKPAWAVIDINLLDPQSDVFPIVQDTFRNAGMLVSTYQYVAVLYRRFDTCSYDAFIAECPSIIRKTYRKKERQLQKKGEVRFEVISEPADMERAIAEYEKVFVKSWKEAEPYPDHTKGLIHEYAAIGVLRMALLFFNDEPIAVHLWIVSNGRARGYKMHYDLEFEHFSVGSILQLRMFKHFLDVEQVKEINFGLGTQQSKRPWVPNERPRQGILACNPKTLLGLKTMARHLLKKSSKSMHRALRPLAQPIKRLVKGNPPRNRGS